MAAMLKSDEIWPVRTVRSEASGSSEVERRILGVLQRWVRYANDQFADWDGRPRCGHFFGGSYWYMSETLATVFALAVASSYGSWDADATAATRALVRERAIRGIRYACFTHDTGPADCVRVRGALSYVSGKKWGGSGDNFFMSSQNGRSIAQLTGAAMLLWDELDPETRRMTQTVVESYADRWADEAPRSGAYYDTQCEENSWTAAGIGAAVALFADHPRLARWKQAHDRWARNAVATPADRAAHPHGLVDTPEGETIECVTFHPDFTAENHGFVHPAYMCAGINLRGLPVALARLAGLAPSPASVRNDEVLYNEVIRHWTLRDGTVAPVQGQDWWYNRQHDALVTHAVMAVVHANTTAALFERDALAAIEAIQASNSRGCLLEEHGERCVINAAHGQYANQLEHGSASDVALAYLIHRCCGSGAPPADRAVVERELTGLRHYPFGGVITHRTPTSFTSFSYRNHVLAYAAPASGMWAVTPHYLSYLGSISVGESAQTTSDARAHPSPGEQVIGVSHDVRIDSTADSFALTALVPRANGALDQQVLFASLPDGASVYAERITAREPLVVAELATGMIGVRNENYAALPEIAPGRTRVFHPHGTLVFEGYYGDDEDRVEYLGACDWINLDDEIGYVFQGSQAVRYHNRHIYEKWRGVEDLLVLNYREDTELAAGESMPLFAVATLPGANADATRAARKDFRILGTGEELIAVEMHDVLIYACHAKAARRSRQATIRQRHAEGATGKGRSERPRVHLYPGEMEIGPEEWTWRATIDGPRAALLKAVFTVDLEDVDGVLRATVADSVAVIENAGGKRARLRLLRDGGGVEEIELAAGQYVTLRRAALPPEA